MTTSPLAETALALFKASLSAVEPATLLAKLQIAPPATVTGQVYLVGAGKASIPLSKAVCNRFPVTAGCISVPSGYLQGNMAIPGNLEVIEAGHPIPDQAGLRAASRAIEFAKKCGPDDLLLVLISGGGSSLWPCFASGISLAHAQQAFTLLIQAGADIAKINVVRKHISVIQGGQLAMAAAPGRVFTLALSDVPGDSLTVIGSGPTVGDPTTFADANSVLHNYGIWDKMPRSIRQHLEQGQAGQIAETPKPTAAIFSNTDTRILGTNADALAGAAEAAKKCGFRVVTATTPVTGEARQVGARLARELQRAPGHEPLCLLWGGETTVRVRGKGKGGRNQETALAAAQCLAHEPRSMVFLSAGTDGIDGPTNAAGALISNHTATQAAAKNMDPDIFLATNDTNTFFENLGGLIETGPTQTNVMDVMIGLRGKGISEDSRVS